MQQYLVTGTHFSCCCNLSGFGYAFPFPELVCLQFSKSYASTFHVSLLPLQNFKCEKFVLNIGGVFNWMFLIDLLYMSVFNDWKIILLNIENIQGGYWHWFLWWRRQTIGIPVLWWLGWMCVGLIWIKIRSILNTFLCSDVKIINNM